MAIFLYFITLCCYVAVFAFIYKRTPNSLYRFVLALHALVILISAAYHTSIYDFNNRPQYSWLYDTFGCYYAKEMLALPNAFENFCIDLKWIAIFSPGLGCQLMVLINAIINHIFSNYFYNGFFFASLVQGCMHLFAVYIFFKLLLYFKISKNWSYIISWFLSYNLYVIILHSIPACESICWLSTACFCFYFWTNQTFLKQFLSALFVGASHKALSLFPYLFYYSFFRKNLIKRLLILSPLFFLITKIIILHPFFKFQEQYIDHECLYGAHSIKNTIPLPSYKRKMLATMEGIFSPILTRNGLLQVNYSHVSAPIAAALDVSMYTLLFYLLVRNIFKKFKTLDENEKRNLIYFSFLLIVLLVIIGINGHNYLTQIRHRSKIIILLLSLLAFLNSNNKTIPIKSRNSV